MKKFVLLLVFVTLLLPKNSLAQEDKKSALGVSPAIFEEILTPGITLEKQITVFNVTNIPLPIKATVTSFIDTPDNLTAEQQKIYDSSLWFKLSEPDFILQPQQEKTLTVTITPPADVEPGGHYATIFFQPLVPMDALSPNSLYVSNRVGALAFMIIGGDIDEKLVVSNLSVLEFMQFGPVSAKLSLTNEGNMHSLPTGDIVIKNMFGKESARLPIKPAFILPYMTRDFDTWWDKTLLFGKYTVRYEGYYGNSMIELTNNPVSFWAIPYVPLTIISIPLLLILILMIVARGRFFTAVRVLFGKEHEQRTLHHEHIRKGGRKPRGPQSHRIVRNKE